MFFFVTEIHDGIIDLVSIATRRRVLTFYDIESFRSVNSNIYKLLVFYQIKAKQQVYAHLKISERL